MATVLKLILLLLGVCGTKAWTYAEQNQWDSLESPVCGGLRQSPIAFSAIEAQSKSYPPLKYFNYDTLNNAKITNNGHTAEITLPDTDDKPQLCGGPLPEGEIYEFTNVHFHWGTNDSLGSEHIVNRQRHAMEVHAVHYNTKYADSQEALQYPDGIVVLTALYQATPMQGLAGLQDVSDDLSYIVDYGSSAEIENFKLSSLYNRVHTMEKMIYYTYPGSLTTPPCAEAVTWIIFANAVNVLSTQLKPFRSLKDEEGNPLVNNYRKVQKKNDRKVYLNRPKNIVPIIGGL